MREWIPMGDQHSSRFFLNAKPGLWKKPLDITLDVRRCHSWVESHWLFDRIVNLGAMMDCLGSKSFKFWLSREVEEEGRLPHWDETTKAKVDISLFDSEPIHS